MTEPEALLETGLAESALPDLAGATILIVDDNLQNLELMHAYLEELPCRIETATDGKEAVDMVERSHPDLVLLDVMMPRMSGFEVCTKIKSNPRTRGTVVIMVTALNEVGDYERAVESGTNEFLTKPVNKIELLTRVKSLLGLALLTRKLDELLALKRRSAPDERGSAVGRSLDEGEDGPVTPGSPGAPRAPGGESGTGDETDPPRGLRGGS